MHKRRPTDYKANKEMPVIAVMTNIGAVEKSSILTMMVKHAEFHRFATFNLIIKAVFLTVKKGGFILLEDNQKHL